MALETNPNLANKISEESRNTIVKDAIEWFRVDLDSRSDWETKRNRWYELATCVPPARTMPWKGAANVCVPMLAGAVQQFQARAYASLFEQPYPERAHIIPVEPSDVQAADDMEHFFNWQLIVEMTEYESEFDKMLMELPVSGTTFKKTFWCSVEDRPKSLYVPASDVILPYKTPSLEKVRRLTERKHEHHEDIWEAGLGENPFYVNTDKVEAAGEQENRESLVSKTAAGQQGESYVQSVDVPNVVMETYAKLQLAGDTRPMPYTAWIDRTSQTLLRLVSRDVKVGATKEVLWPWMDYHFIPNPEGFYSYGLGYYMEQLNCIQNTNFNLWLDAGHLANSPMVFYSRAAGLKMREVKIRPGGSAQVNDPSQINIWKFPGTDQALPQMMQEVRRMAEDIGSPSDEVQGRAQKGVREPTVKGTMARVEQSLVTFGVSTKRVFRQQAKEFKQIIKLNSLFQKETKQFRVLGATSEVPFRTIKRSDMSKHFDVFPTADPSFASPQQRRAEASEVMNVSLTHPLLVGNPETGQPGNVPAQLAILRDYLMTFQKRDLVTYIPEPPKPSVPPEVENAMFMAGDFSRPKQGEQHAEHMAFHMEFIDTEAYREMPEDRKELHRRHVNLTQRIMVAEAEQQAQQQAAAAQQNGGISQ